MNSIVQNLNYLAYATTGIWLAVTVSNGGSAGSPGSPGLPAGLQDMQRTRGRTTDRSMALGPSYHRRRSRGWILHTRSYWNLCHDATRELMSSRGVKKSSARNLEGKHESILSHYLKFQNAVTKKFAVKKSALPIVQGQFQMINIKDYIPKIYFAQKLLTFLVKTQINCPKN